MSTTDHHTPHYALTLSPQQPVSLYRSHSSLHISHVCSRKVYVQAGKELSQQAPAKRTCFIIPWLYVQDNAGLGHHSRFCRCEGSECLSNCYTHTHSCNCTSEPCSLFDFLAVYSAILSSFTLSASALCDHRYSEARHNNHTLLTSPPPHCLTQTGQSHRRQTCCRLKCPPLVRTGQWASQHQAS